MNDIDRIQKLLATNKNGQSGWRKVLSKSTGSHSRSLAEKNLSRLVADRITLLSQLHSINLQD